jgi:hypothetical protein
MWTKKLTFLNRIGLKSESQEDSQKEEAIIQLGFTIHRKVFIKNCRMYVFGGQDIKEGSFSNLYKIDISFLRVNPEETEVKRDFREHEWELIKTKGDIPGWFMLYNI